ncbi:hypothetical protein FLA_4404 [Filimonas lacunae]|nr:hypothetical protein FLA_4404 [Filimonas lacunae]
MRLKWQQVCSNNFIYREAVYVMYTAFYFRICEKGRLGLSVAG